MEPFISIREAISEGSKERPREPLRASGLPELILKETWGLDNCLWGFILLTRVPTTIIRRVH